MSDENENEIDTTRVITETDLLFAGEAQPASCRDLAESWLRIAEDGYLGDPGDEELAANLGPAGARVIAAAVASGLSRGPVAHALRILARGVIADYHGTLAVRGDDAWKEDVLAAADRVDRERRGVAALPEQRKSEIVEAAISQVDAERSDPDPDHGGEG